MADTPNQGAEDQLRSDARRATRWHVEINWHGNDRRLLEDILAGFDVKIEQTERGYFLVSEQFEALSGSGGYVHSPRRSLQQ